MPWDTDRTMHMLTNLFALCVFLMLLPCTIAVDSLDGLMYVTGISNDNRRRVLKAFGRATALAFTYIATLIFYPSLIEGLGWARVAFEGFRYPQNCVVVCSSDGMLGDLIVILCLLFQLVYRSGMLCAKLVVVCFSCMPMLSSVALCMYVVSAQT